MLDFKTLIFIFALTLVSAGLAGIGFFQWMELGIKKQEIAILNDQAIANQKELSYLRQRNEELETRLNRLSSANITPKSGSTTSVAGPVINYIMPNTTSTKKSDTENNNKMARCTYLYKMKERYKKDADQYSELFNEFRGLGCPVRHNDYF